MDHTEESKLQEQLDRAEAALNAYIEKHGEKRSPEYTKLHQERDAAFDALAAYRGRKSDSEAKK